MGLSDENYKSFNAEGLNTMGTFAFSCSYAPGAADERPLITLATQVPSPINEGNGMHSSIVQ